MAGLSLNGTNFLDLSDISFGASTKATYTETTAGGTLQVTDGTHTANINLSGNYTASTFVAASDGHGGTLVHDRTNSVALLVQSMASLPRGTTALTTAPLAIPTKTQQTLLSHPPNAIWHFGELP